MGKESQRAIGKMYYVKQALIHLKTMPQIETRDVLR